MLSTLLFDTFNVDFVNNLGCILIYLEGAKNWIHNGLLMDLNFQRNILYKGIFCQILNNGSKKL